MDPEHSACDSDQFEQGLEPDHTDHYADHQPAFTRAWYPERLRAWRHQPQCFPLSGEFRQTDLGRWSNDDISNGYRLAAWQWQVGGRARVGGTYHAGALGDWSARE